MSARIFCSISLSFLHITADETLNSHNFVYMQMLGMEDNLKCKEYSYCLFTDVWNAYTD